MFEQHPVPQQISSYQFRLVGDMNIKQFFQIAAGAIVALIIYGLPFPAFLKWPLIILAALSGAAFAFLPIQDRPLEQWLFAFFRSIYSPTYFVWQQQVPPPQFFKPDEVGAVAIQVPLTPTQEQTQDMKVAAETQVEEAVVPDFISTNTEAEAPVPVQVNSAPAPVVAPAVEQPAQPVYTSVVEQVVPEVENLEQTMQAQFSPDAAPPIPPDLPNIIKGQVMDASGHIIQGAILEIKDSEGRPVRALRSNNVGHFQIVTSLPNGSYTITIDKEGYEFDLLSINATGELISPIAIRAKQLQ